MFFKSHFCKLTYVVTYHFHIVSTYSFLEWFCDQVTSNFLLILTWNVEEVLRSFYLRFLSVPLFACILDTRMGDRHFSLRFTQYFWRVALCDIATRSLYRYDICERRSQDVFTGSSGPSLSPLCVLKLVVAFTSNPDERSLSPRSSHQELFCQVSLGPFHEGSLTLREKVTPHNVKWFLNRSGHQELTPTKTRGPL